MHLRKRNPDKLTDKALNNQLQKADMLNLELRAYRLLLTEQRDQRIVPSTPGPNAVHITLVAAEAKTEGKAG